MKAFLVIVAIAAVIGTAWGSCLNKATPDDGLTVLRVQAPAPPVSPPTWSYSFVMDLSGKPTPLHLVENTIKGWTDIKGVKGLSGRFVDFAGSSIALGGGSPLGYLAGGGLEGSYEFEDHFALTLGLGGAIFGNSTPKVFVWGGFGYRF